MVKVLLEGVESIQSVWRRIAMDLEEIMDRDVQELRVDESPVHSGVVIRGSENAIGECSQSNARACR
jgi:hypothetical protein